MKGSKQRGGGERTMLLVRRALEACTGSSRVDRVPVRERHDAGTSSQLRLCWEAVDCPVGARLRGSSVISLFFWIPMRCTCGMAESVEWGGFRKKVVKM